MIVETEEKRCKTCHYFADDHCRRKLGYFILPSAWQAIGQQSNGWLNNTFTNSLLGALISFIIFAVGQTYLSYYQTSRTKLSEVSLTYLLFGAIGAIIGLTLGVVISTPLYNMEIPFVNSVLPILLMIILGYLGLRMGTTRIEEWKKVLVHEAKSSKKQLVKLRVNC